jgi:HEAT repeat protein
MPVSVALRRPLARRAVLDGALALALAAVGAGCVHPREPVRLDSPDINTRIAAIKRVAETKDRTAAPQLVALLDDEDPAVRFFAIEALERIAGDRKGYDYYDDAPDDRRPAIARWHQWLVDQGMTPLPAKRP